MNDSVTIFVPDGSLPYTSRVEYANVETHIAARDQFADEARLLKEFHEAEYLPDTLGDGAYVIDQTANPGQRDGVCYHRYILAD